MTEGGSSRVPPDPDAQIVSLRAELAVLQSQLEIAQRALRNDRERELLLRGELQHRVRNILALIRSIFSRTVASGGTMEEVTDHFRGRFDVLARYQSFRVNNPGGGSAVDLLVREELHDFQFGDDPRISIAGDAISLNHDQAQTFALALHELVTNSLKFGALSRATGCLYVAWQVAATMFTFTWSETDIETASLDDIRYGFGRELIEQGLPYQLGARTEFSLSAERLDVTIAFSTASWQAAFADPTH